MTDSVAPRVAYLVSEYPKLSHAFIEREVRALRAAGAEVRTFSVRPAPGSELLSQANRAEHATTTALLRSRRELVMALLRLAATDPGALADGVRLAVRTGPRTLRARIWQLFYLVEAVLLVQHLRATGVRHLHVHLANNGADVARLAVALGTRLDGEPWSWSLAMHGPTEFSDVVGSDLAAKVRSAAFVACITDFCRSQLMTLVGTEHWDKLHLVRMTVDAERFEATARDVDHGGPLRVLFVGRLVPEKGPQLLLQAVAALPAGTVEVRVVGDGPLRGTLEQDVTRLGLADRVTVVGPLGQEQLPDQYAWADVFCLPSFAEGLPVVLMEAMASGCTVLTTAIAGIPELVEHRVTGLLVTPGRVDALTRALADSAADSTLRHQMVAEARQRVHERHSPEVNAKRLLALLPR